MKKLPILALAFFALFLCQQAVHAEDGLKKITESVYSYTDVKNASPKTSFGANAGIIIGKDYLVAVDSLISAKEGKRFIKDIKKVSKKPVKFLINTHYHLDHSLGNSEFAKLGAVIIAHANDQENMQKAGEGMLQYAKQWGLSDQDLKGTKLAYPTLTFGDRLTLDLGNNKIEVLFIGPSHTTGSVLVFVPKEKVLFTGDILFTDFHPFLGEANIEGWIKVLDQIMAMDVEKIIPGHGPVSSKKDVADLKNYLSVFDQKAKEMTAKSQDLNFIVAEMKKSLPPRAQLDALITKNIQMKYLPKEKQSQPQAK
ncbi:MAG: MBL fold metallo-hydrolase [Deltaproteobacteria bacterium]|nr:MAG: MBL fold metallo-hydrolase [Deltaproteobacteria bacterium]